MQKNLYGCPLTQTRTTDTEGVGNLREEADGSVYRWVKNNHSATVTLGQILFHDLANQSDTLKSATIAATANLSLMAGVVVATDGIAAASYGWIQVAGQNSSISISGATTGGVNIAIGDYIKGANAALYGVRDTSTTPTYRRNIQILTTVATTTTPAAANVTGLIHCR